MPAHISSTTRAVAVILADDGAAHLDQRRPQRVEGADVELRGRVEPACGDGAGRREHAVTADELAGSVLANQQVVAELVEAVGISTGRTRPSSERSKPGSEVNTS